VGTWTRIEDLLNRLGSYALWEVLVELLIIWIVVFAAIRFLQGTRAARAIKGLLLVLVIGTLIVRVLGGDTLMRLTFLYDRLLAVIALALVVIFQPELRRGLIRLGETRLVGSTRQGAEFLAAELSPACKFLSKAKFGAIIVLERRVGLKSYIDGGTLIDAKLSSALIQTIFHPGSALHDLAVVIRAERVHSAGVQLPMASPAEVHDLTLGSRHRAAVGVSSESDALVIVVSEETGCIRLAERGKLSSPVKVAKLERILRERLGHPAADEDAKELVERAEQNDPDKGFVERTDTKPKPKPKPESKPDPEADNKSARATKEAS